MISTTPKGSGTIAAVEGKLVIVVWTFDNRACCCPQSGNTNGIYLFIYKIDAQSTGSLQHRIPSLVSSNFLFL